MSSTIKQAILSLKSRVADAYTAVSQKGGTLPATQDSANLPTAIASIPSGGGSPYDDLAQIGFSQNDIDLLTGYETPTAEDIASALPYVGRSGTGFRALNRFNGRYSPPYTVTDKQIEQFFLDSTNVEICGELTSSAPIKNALNFCNGSNFKSVLRYLCGDELDLSSCSSIMQLFASNPLLVRIPRIILPTIFNDTHDMYRVFYEDRALRLVDFGDSSTAGATNLRQAFCNCYSLKQIKGTIDLTSVLDNNYYQMFSGCMNLIDVRIKNCGYSLSLSDSPLLSYDSLLYLVQNVKNVSGYTLTIGSTNIAKLNATADGQAAIATAQGYGWTIA